MSLIDNPDINILLIQIGFFENLELLDTDFLVEFVVKV